MEDECAVAFVVGLHAEYDCDERCHTDGQRLGCHVDCVWAAGCSGGAVWECWELGGWSAGYGGDWGGGWCGGGGVGCWAVAQVHLGSQHEL
jgi:hypothetical protein